MALIFNGTITRGSDPYTYSVNMWVYIFEEIHDITLFWLPLQGYYGSSQTSLTSYCWGSVSTDDSSRILSFSCYDNSSRSFTKNNYENITTHSVVNKRRNAWQYFSFQYRAKSINYTNSYAPEHASHLMSESYSSGGTIASKSLTNTSSDHRLTTHSSIGRFVNDSDSESYYPLVGLIYKISFYNTNNNGGNIQRIDLVNLYKDAYFLHFKLGDMNQNSYSDNMIRK